MNTLLQHPTAHSSYGGPVYSLAPAAPVLAPAAPVLAPAAPVRAPVHPSLRNLLNPVKPPEPLYRREPDSPHSSPPRYILMPRAMHTIEYSTPPPICWPARADSSDCDDKEEREEELSSDDEQRGFVKVNDDGSQTVVFYRSRGPETKEWEKSPVFSDDEARQQQAQHAIVNAGSFIQAPPGPAPFQRAAGPSPELPPAAPAPASVVGNPPTRVRIPLENLTSQLDILDRYRTVMESTQMNQFLTSSTLLSAPALGRAKIREAMKEALEFEQQILKCEAEEAALAAAAENGELDDDDDDDEESDADSSDDEGKYKPSDQNEECLEERYVDDEEDEDEEEEEEKYEVLEEDREKMVQLDGENKDEDDRKVDEEYKRGNASNNGSSPPRIIVKSPAYTGPSAKANGATKSPNSLRKRARDDIDAGGASSSEGDSLDKDGTASRASKKQRVDKPRNDVQQVGEPCGPVDPPTNSGRNDPFPAVAVRSQGDEEASSKRRENGVTQGRGTSPISPACSSKSKGKRKASEVEADSDCDSSSSSSSCSSTESPTAKRSRKSSLCKIQVVPAPISGWPAASGRTS